MKHTYFDELCEVLTGIQSRGDARLLLQDLLTPSERRSVAERVQLVKLLLREVPQREISARLKISIAKVTRGSRALKMSRGGFRKFIRP